MSDVPGFVYAKDLIAQANATDKWVRTQLRRTRRANVGWRIYAVLMTFLVVILVAALDYTIPMIRLVPVLLWTSPDGVTGAAVTPDEPPGRSVRRLGQGVALAIRDAPGKLLVDRDGL